MFVKVALEKEGVFFAFDEKPMKKEENQENAAAGEQNRSLALDDFGRLPARLKSRRKRIDDTKTGSGKINDKKRQDTADYEDGK